MTSVHAKNIELTLRAKQVQDSSNTPEGKQSQVENRHSILFL